MASGPRRLRAAALIALAAAGLIGLLLLKRDRREPVTKASPPPVGEATPPASEPPRGAPSMVPPAKSPAPRGGVGEGGTPAAAPSPVPSPSTPLPTPGPSEEASPTPEPDREAILVRMATLAPDGSSWHRILIEMKERWKALSGGRVTVRLFPGGIAGDDPNVVRKMRLGTLEAGVLTSVGVAEVDKSVYALGVPLMYDSHVEVYTVLERMRPRLEAGIEAKGFVVLNWADGGWNHFFTHKPVARPDDLRALKLFSWAGDNDAIELWKSAGFNPVPLPATEIATALQTGLINAIAVSPQVAVISQYYTRARNMTDMPWQLLLGATLIRKATWERIPAELRPALLEAARQAGARLREEIRKSGEKDVEEMKKRGLNVVPVSPQQRAEWQKLTEDLYPKIRGVIVPTEAFDEARGLRDAYRGGASPP